MTIDGESDGDRFGSAIAVGALLTRETDWLVGAMAFERLGREPVRPTYFLIRRMATSSPLRPMR